MSLREAAKMALEDICGAKLCEINSMSSRVEMLRLMDSAITALREALAEPEQEQEPVAWWDGNSKFAIPKAKDWDKRTGGTTAFGCDIPLYTAPTPRNDINAELVEALKWIGDRCPAILLDQPLHRGLHMEAAYDAGACARAALAKVEESK